MRQGINKAKSDATKRATLAEQSVMVRENENVAEAEQAQFLSTYMAILDETEGLTDRQRRFLSELAISGMPTQACYRVGVPAGTYRRWIHESPEFRALVEETRQFANDKLEQVAIDLATGQYMRPLVSQGIIAGYERIFDTKVLLALLKSRKPNEFAQRIDVTSNGHSLVKLVDKDTWDSV